MSRVTTPCTSENGSGGLAAEPRDAATVIVVRESRDASPVELFCVERHARSGFLGGAVVFPGGKVDDSDRSAEWSELTTPLSTRVLELSRDPACARAFAVAALREALEEAAILPVTPHDLDAGAALELREQVARSTLAGVLRARGLRLDTARLEAVSRWITPTLEPRRFDARFFLLAVPPGQAGAHDNHETTRSFWASATEILQRWERGEVVLAPPTSLTVSLFTHATTIGEALTIARRQSLDPILPCFVEDGAGMVLTLPGDPLHPEPAPPPSDPALPTRFVLEDGRLVPQRPSR